jgi:zinc protease
MLTIHHFFLRASAYRTTYSTANALRRFAFFMIFFLSSPAFATNQPLTHEYKLENGLKLIVKEDHRSPIASVQVWYKVGGSYEPNGISGISHALEHMMFRGTTKYPDGELTRLIAINGGDQNAFTAPDFTAYHQELSIDQIPLCLELEADRMVNLALTDAAFEQEIKVVREERRLSYDDNPDHLTYERMNAAAFLSSPYHQPNIGWMHDLEAMTAADIRSWYQKWYGPNNAIVVIVGDVNPDKMVALVKEHFGPLKAITLPNIKPRPEVVSMGTRQVQVEIAASVPRLWMSYNVPSLLTATDPNESYALLTLLMALDGGNSTRFAKNLIRGQEIATNINSSYNPFARHETLLFFSGIPTGNHTIPELEEAFLQEIARLQNELLSPEELDRVKTNAIAQHIFTHDAMDDQALMLGMMESLGLGWQLSETYPDYIQKVSAEDVQKVAKKYLIPQRYTRVELIPLKSGT